MLRLHCNESHYGAPAAALEAAADELARLSSIYPDHECAALRRRLAAALEVSPEAILVANGADELIHLIALAVPSGRSRIIAVTDHTFPGYAAAAAVADAEMRVVPVAGDAVCPGAVAAALRDGADVAFVCNPHNPLGTMLDEAGVAEILEAADATGALAVFDEAYIEFAETGRDTVLDAIRAGRRALILRTFSKAWGLAALRVGYAVGGTEPISRLRAAHGSTPFSVNRIAQRAATAALDELDFPDRVRKQTAAARDHLCRRLAALGVGYIRSEANFVLVRPAGGPDLAQRLAAEHGILVRDMAALDLPGSLRVTVGSESQMDAFCDALSILLSGAPADGPASPTAHESEKR